MPRGIDDARRVNVEICWFNATAICPRNDSKGKDLQNMGEIIRRRSGLKARISLYIIYYSHIGASDADGKYCERL